MTPLEKADHAKRLLADPLLKEAFGSIKDSFIARAEASGMDDIDTHHHIALSLQLLRQLRIRLEQYLSDQALLEHAAKQQTWIDRAKQRIRA